MKYVWLLLSVVVLIRSGFYINLDIYAPYYDRSIFWHIGGLLPGLIFIWLTWRAFKKPNLKK